MDGAVFGGAASNCREWVPRMLSSREKATLLGGHRHADGSQRHAQSRGHSGDFCPGSRPRTQREEQSTRLRCQGRSTSTGRETSKAESERRGR